MNFDKISIVNQDKIRKSLRKFDRKITRKKKILNLFPYITMPTTTQVVDSSFPNKILKSRYTTANIYIITTIFIRKLQERIR